jgi:hypothetical protein
MYRIYIKPTNDMESRKRRIILAFGYLRPLLTYLMHKISY